VGNWDDRPLGEEELRLRDDGGLILSASSVATFLRCGKQWEYAYVHRERRPPTVKQALGLAAHDAYEQDLTAKLATGDNLPEALVLDVFSTEYDRLSLEFDNPDEDPAKAKDQQIKVVRKYRNELAPLIEPVMVEESFIIEVNGLAFSGTLDLASIHRIKPDSTRIKVRDWKNVSKKPSDTAGYAFGMVGYALGYRVLADDVEDEAQIDYLVRYKRDPPAYFPISSGGPVSDAAIESFADTLRRVFDAIMAGKFVPNGLQNNACSWCGYATICPAYKNRIMAA
jgi:hypothetical protein